MEFNSLKLGIISDCHHYYNTEGNLCSLTPVVLQFEAWAKMFEDVIICAPLLSDPIPTTYQTTYKATNIQLLPIENAGGNNLQAKLFLAQKTIGWWSTLKGLTKKVDAIHIRCPNNISILGLLAIHNTPLLRQAVYTGSWNGHNNEALTYKAQRIFLKYFFHGPVAVYGTWSRQPSNIVPSFSPSLTQDDWDSESYQIRERLLVLRRMNTLPMPIHLLSVGALIRNKNQGLIIEALLYLLKKGFDCTLDLLGEGSQRAVLEKQVHKLGLTERVILHGNVPQGIVRNFYRQASFVIQAPYAEGFGKVPIEAFYHGAIPLLSEVDMSSQITGMGLRGRCFSPHDAQEIANQVMDLAQNPALMADMIENGREYARGTTIEAWQNHLRTMLNFYWNINLNDRKLDI